MELQQRFENHEVGVSKGNFYEIISNARLKALTSENIRSGFWSSGMIPSDGETILQQLWDEQAAQERAKQTKPELSLVAQNQLLHNIELTQVEQLRTQQNPAELENQAQLILDDIPPVSPRSWHRRHILENIINCAQYRMTENKLKDERIQTL